jgi:hypothetical protein
VNEKTDNHCLVAPDERPLYQRLVGRLFPGRYLECPENLDGFAPAYVINEVVTVFDWKDRLRLLWSGKLRVHTRIKTDVVVSRMESESAVSVLPPWYALSAAAPTREE